MRRAFLTDLATQGAIFTQGTVDPNVNISLMFLSFQRFRTRAAVPFAVNRLSHATLPLRVSSTSLSKVEHNKSQTFVATNQKSI
jgi:hypothetical protein